MPALLLVASAWPACAAELVVDVRTASGQPVPNAVVSLYPAGKPAAFVPARGPYRIAQRNTQFQPFVLIVPVGGQVAFPNYDSFRHHVYSFSPAKRFELKLYAREQDRTVRFDRAGVVPLGCNIHDQMTAFVKVADTGLVAQSDAAGRIVFANVAAGPLVARLWHPYLRLPGNQAEFRWILPARGSQRHTLTVKLRSPPRPDAAY
ncbi:MAG TPA: methylamine utilization protein [Allosphingosinicella sp.]|nr:methylamine utilization protein [Allosphingosinicella sp.]